jgi:hypothetical protein
LAEIWAYVAAEASEAIATRLIKKITMMRKSSVTFPNLAPNAINLAKDCGLDFRGATRFIMWRVKLN